MFRQACRTNQLGLIVEESLDFGPDAIGARFQTTQLVLANIAVFPSQAFNGPPDFGGWIALNDDKPLELCLSLGAHRTMGPVENPTLDPALMQCQSIDIDDDTWNAMVAQRDVDRELRAGAWMATCGHTFPEVGKPFPFLFSAWVVAFFALFLRRRRAERPSPVPVRLPLEIE